MTARITDNLTAALDLAASDAAKDVAAYASPRGTMTSYDDARVGRMLAREPFFAVLVPLAIAEIGRLRDLINTPRTDDWIESVRLEAAHQIDRWGIEHDAGKRPEDWIALLVYLLGKATKSHFEGDAEKLKHHIISTSAALLNWHRALTGESNVMRPGVGTHEVKP